MAQLYLTDAPKSPGSSSGSGLSVLRTFRLLRILKLVRFMPNLRRQLFVMLRTMDNVAVFFSLLILFIFIFRNSLYDKKAVYLSIELCDEHKETRRNFEVRQRGGARMYLFGGKFCMLSDGTRRCDCREIVERDPRCVCDRKHFNNILWATVTVFQT
ncbi:Uncharacterized protein GBIM_08918 [Gryllus bimaculatus]|nr:Uncharacterized protein GBIM_08918 [Gryllus bimaculatus]